MESSNYKTLQFSTPTFRKRKENQIGEQGFKMGSESDSKPIGEVITDKPPPLTPAERKAKAQLLIVGPILLVSAFAVMGVLGWLCLDGRINLAGKTESLSTYAEKLEFTVKYQVLGVAWLLFCFLLVMSKRGTTGALNPLLGIGQRELYLTAARNVFQNSLEQFCISMFAQIILISFISGEYTMKTIPLVNFLFLLSRLAFWLGYPSYRTFGVATAIVPSSAMIWFSAYKFCEHLF